MDSTRRDFLILGGKMFVMTGIADPVRLRQLDGLGACMVLQKPLTQPAVLDAIARARYLSVTSNGR